MDFTMSSMALVFAAGLTSVASPCVLPVIPIVVTGAPDDHKFRPLLIVAGLSVSFITMGIISSLFFTLIAGRMLYVEKAVGVIIAIFGVMMLFDLNLFKKITFLGNIQVSSQGRWSGLLLGMSLGIIWIPCVGPMLSGVLSLVATQEHLISGTVLLAIYSLGFSVPILLAAYGSHFFRTRLSLFQKHALSVRLLGGCLLIVFGVFIFKQGMLGFNV
jgi:cytochrome c-type biogenesis protein